MPQPIAVSAMLSRAFVAFTIEVDNELEHAMPHTTATGPAARSSAGPWLVSHAMWVNALQYVPADGVAVSALHQQARTTHLNLPGLTRWRYVTFSDDPDPVVRLTAWGARAAEIWRPLAPEIEGRWRQRYGEAPVASLASALRAIVDTSGRALPRCLPITSPTQNGRAEPAMPASQPDGDRDLVVLLGQALQLFALDFEQASRISLPISANLLRVLDSEPVRLRDLPALTGIARAGIDMALGFLTRRDCATIGPDPHSSRGQVAMLTTKGRRAQAKYRTVLEATELSWRERYTAAVDSLLVVLESIDLVVPEPYPGGWRASVTALPLPDFPMVLHRGGYPDGS